MIDLWVCHQYMIYLISLLGLVVGVSVANLTLWMASKDDELKDSAVLKALRKRGPWIFPVLTGLVFAAMFYLNARVFGINPELVYWQLIGSLLIMAALQDLIFRLITLTLLLVLGGIVLLESVMFSTPLIIGEALSGAVVVGAVILAVYLVTKRKGIGEADIFLAVIIGLLFGWVKGIIVFAFANFLGLATMIPMIMVFGKKRTKFVPLVFFLVLSIFLEWYVGFTDLILKLIGL